jgi:hypothetical protein
MAEPREIAMPNRAAIAWVALIVALTCCSCATFGPGAGWLEPSSDIDEPMTLSTPKVDDVAAAIDRLERHIERYGSIVPQHASVWGQSRLMMFRNEFERVMRADIYTFTQTIQGTISTSDQAFLANALSLQAGAGQAAGTDPMKLLTDPNDAITRNNLTKMAAISNYVTPNGTLALEPTLLEDQKKRYLDHLHQLRRINEGDDNTDAPGYGLNLVRLPISVLSGEHTQTGFGAECTFTASLHLADDLLPQTFRELVANDITDLLTLPLTRFIETTDEASLQADLDRYEAAGSNYAKAKTKQEDYRKQFGTADQGLVHSENESKNELDKELSNQFSKLSRDISSNVPNSPRRINQSPIPPSQIILTFGAHNLSYLTQHVRKPLKDHLGCKDTPYHLDVQAWLRNELGAAYQYLSQPSTEHLWSFCGPSLAHAIRTQDRQTIIDIQTAFFKNIAGMVQLKQMDNGLLVQRTATSILAWTIIIDASLLNERFHEDMQATHNAKGCPCPPTADLPLFLPHPPPEVCQAFNNYVQCRWPLHIFALDPETEDQNIGDSFSLRRELQLAMSVAFTSGKISAQDFTQYVRRIEKDIDTIALNRTIIGFSHGDNTFGWRFFPRVQTPPVEGNLQTIFRDLLCGGYGPGYDLRRRRLENGIRECVALVIMPSFVPDMDLEVTANWFRLDDPKCKALNLKQTMSLSQTVKCIQDSSHALCDEQCYRAGDTGLMYSKLEQLSQRLPLQRQQVSVPYENTHGGFEMLSTGVTDLAPELDGWYGAPGINPNDETNLFLVGDNFSVHQTRVIVGGRLLDPTCTVTCNTTGAAPLDCAVCPAAATTASPAPSASAPAPTMTMPMDPAPPALLSPPLTLPEQGKKTLQESGLQLASWVTSSNVRPPQPPTTIITIVPAGQTSDKSSGTTAAPGTKSTTTKTTTSNSSNTPATSDQTASQDNTTAPSSTKSGNGSTTSPAANTPTSSAQQTNTTTTTSTACADPSCRVEIPHFQVELLSRQVMRVIIPKGVYSNNGIVDVHIATPYGVSPHLSIPVICPNQNKAPTNLLQLSPDAATATVRCCWSKDALNPGDGKLVPVNWSPGNLPLKWAANSELTPKSITVQLTFNSPKGKLPPLKMMVAAGNSGSFALPLSEVVSPVLSALVAVGQYKLGDALPASIQGTVTLLNADSTPIYDSIGAVTQKVQLQFELVQPTPSPLGQPQQ